MRLDCVTADFNSKSLSILYGRTEASEPLLRRGDADLDGKATLTDAIVVLEMLLRGGAPLRCEDTADANDDAVINLTDAVFPLTYLFRGGAESAGSRSERVRRGSNARPSGAVRESL